MSERQAIEKKRFRLEEATIAELHQAIRAGETTVVAVVRHYIERARAYNGVASLLVTADGAPIPRAAARCARGRRSAFRPRPSRRRRSCPISTNIAARRSNSDGWSRPPPTPRCSSNTA